MTAHRKNPIAAAVMSAVVPGAGQVYAGSYVVGAFWILITGASWYADQPILALACHALASVSAYWAVQRLNPAKARRHRRS